MEDNITGLEGHFIASINRAMNDASLFDDRNNLTSAGKSTFWCTLDGLIEQFDKKQISLKPLVRSSVSRWDADKKSSDSFRSHPQSLARH